ncbi:hypothetical protein ACFWHR_03820 [Leucobacter sp. NPDC058333]|uniref:hypothetical protein n=1 Tax=Leucobacter sp. NPDC058333 TaxID=3346450 RepID=UPI0036685A2D
MQEFPSPHDLFTVLGAAALVTAGTLIGAWLSSRREHNKWVREQRFEAYVNALTMLLSLKVILSEFDDVKAEHEEAVELVHRALEEGIAVDGRSQQIGEKLDALGLRLEESELNAPSILSPIEVLGPDKVARSLDATAKALRDRNPKEIAAAERHMRTTMREALNLR